MEKCISWHWVLSQELSEQIYPEEDIAAWCPSYPPQSLGRMRALDKTLKALQTPMCHGKDLENTIYRHGGDDVGM